MAATFKKPGLAMVLMLGACALPVLGLAQAVPPPGVDAARAPTERTLRPSGKAQNRDRVLLSQDCRKAEADMREQFRIQAEGVRSQYASRIAKADPAARSGLEKERDARIHELHAQGESAAKQFGDHCREDNREVLRAPQPVDAR
jgi:hypothetical protein